MKNNQKREQLIALRNGEMVVEKANEYWTEEDAIKSKKMFENGEGVSDIALALKRTEVSVVCSLQNRGLFARQCKPRTKASRTDKAVCLCTQCQVKDCRKKDCNRKNCQDFKQAEE